MRSIERKIHFHHHSTKKYSSSNDIHGKYPFDQVTIVKFWQNVPHTQIFWSILYYRRTMKYRRGMNFSKHVMTVI